MGFVSKVELEDLVSSLSEELKFLKAIYDAVCICANFSGTSIPLDFAALLLNVLFYLKELFELRENMKETSVVVQMDNSRALNMDQVVSAVKLQYEDLAARGREEAESWHRTKVIKQKE